MPTPVIAPVGLLYRELQNIRSVGSEPSVSDPFFQIPGVAGPGEYLRRLVELPLNYPFYLLDAIEVRETDSSGVELSGPVRFTAIGPLAPLVSGSFVIKQGTTDSDDTFRLGFIKFSQFDAGRYVKVLYRGRGSLVWSDDVKDVCKGLSLLPEVIRPGHISVGATDDFVFPRDIYVRGNFHVDGYIEKEMTTVLTTADDILLLNSEAVAPGPDVGLEFGRGGSNPFFIWKETDDSFNFIKSDGSTELVKIYDSGPLTLEVFGDIAVDGHARIRVSSSSDPLLVIEGDNGSATLEMLGWGTGNSVGVPTILCGHAEGTSVLPDPTADGNILMLLAGIGAVGSAGSAAFNYSDPGGYMVLSANGNWSPTARGTNFGLFLTPFGSTGPLSALHAEMPSDGNPRVGIGTSFPGFTLEVVSDNASARGLVSTAYGDSGPNQPILRGRRARGTQATPTGVQSGDNLLQVSGTGYVGTPTNSFRAAAAGQITLSAAENWTSSAQGTYWSFYTVPIGGTSQSEKMRLHSGGAISVGSISAAPTAILDLVSTTKGFLGPRMSTVQRTGISSPATGLLVYDLTLDEYWVNKSTGWSAIGTGGGGGGGSGPVQEDTTVLLINSPQSVFPVVTTLTAASVVDVYVNGILQPTSSYSVSIGLQQVTLSTPRTTGELVTILIYEGPGGAVGGSNGSVQFNNAGLLDGDVTNFFWDNTNKRLGIGTSSPAENLVISGSADTSVLVADTAGATVRIKASGSAGQLGTASSHQLDLLTNGLARVTVDTSGKVGIGLTSPAATLDILGNIKIVDTTQGVGKVLTSDAAGLASWQAPSGGAPSGSAGGDLAGTYPNPTVANINGVAVSGLPILNQVIVSTSPTTAAWASIPLTGSASGDLSGTYPGPTVVKVNGVTISGTPSSGQWIAASGATAASWQNPTAGGDLSGNYPAPVVAKVNGVTVSGVAALGKVLTATSASACQWQDTNVKALYFDVSGQSVPAPTSGQVLIKIITAHAVGFSALFAGSYGKCSPAATASTTFSIKKNGVTSGTMVFAPAATTATFTGTMSTIAGDVITVVAPAVPDTTLADLTFVLAGALA